MCMFTCVGVYMFVEAKAQPQMLFLRSCPWFLDLELAH